MSTIQAQEKTDLPFYEIPTAPDTYSSGNIVSRMIDGLGYRFYWASEGLKEKDLAYTISDDSRSMLETLTHIYDLSVTIKNVANRQPNIRPYEKIEMSYDKLRAQSLQNLYDARNHFVNLTEKQLESYLITFQNNDKKSEYPFWNFFNGPLADAIYHTGQVVVFRRASGNPMSSKVSVFSGKNSN